jgi:hypothetical protein
LKTAVVGSQFHDIWFQDKEGVTTDHGKNGPKAGKSHPPKNLVDFFRQSPLVGLDLDLERNRDVGREVDLGPSSPPKVGTVDPIPQK